MSPSPSRRPAKGGNIKKGICQNHSYLNPDTGETGDCPKCASGEVISVNVQRLSDFRCPVCEGKLTPYKEKNTKKYVMIGGGVALAVAATAFAIGFGGKDNTDTTGEGKGPDTTVVDNKDDSAKVVNGPDTAITKPETPQTPQKPEPQSQPQPTPKSVLGGAAVIINEGSYKTLRFKRDYDLDLGKTDGSTLHISAGEEINNAHIVNGKLLGGNYRNHAGDEQSLYGINITL